MIILDVHDELGQRLEVQSAASELANVGEEGGGGDACHGLCYIEEQQHRASGKEIAHTHARTHRQAGRQQQQQQLEQRRTRARNAARDGEEGPLTHVIPVDMKYCTLVLLHKNLYLDTSEFVKTSNCIIINKGITMALVNFPEV